MPWLGGMASLTLRYKGVLKDSVIHALRYLANVVIGLVKQPSGADGKPEHKSKAENRFSIWLKSSDRKAETKHSKKSEK